MKDEKPCSVCKVTKPLEEFNRSKKEKDGRCYHCKVCASIKGKEQRAKIKDDTLQGLRDDIMKASKKSESDLEYILERLSHATLSNQHTVEALDSLKDLAERRLGL